MAFDAFAFDVETFHDADLARYPGDKPGLDPNRNRVFWVSLAGPGRSDAIALGHPLGARWSEARDILAPYTACPAKSRCQADVCRSGEVPLTARGVPSLRQIKHRIPARFGPPPEQIDPDSAWQVLKPLLLGDALKVGHNVKFDAKSLAKYLGEPVRGPLGDTMILARLVDENEANYDLGAVTERALRWTYDKSLGKAGVETFAFDEAAKYARLDALATWLDWQALTADLERQGKRMVAVHDLERRVLEAAVDMEMAGAPIDVEGFQALEKDLNFRLRQIEKEIEEFNGGPINLNADRQVAALVYGKRGHEPKIFTEKAQEPSVSRKALEPYAYRGDPNAEEPKIKDPCVAAVLEHAQTSKVYSTYIINNLADVEATGRLYGQFNQLGTKTGRFSASNPNLQNIPVRRGKQVRDLFIAPPGFKLVVMDYSQVELRVLAHFTQDPTLLKAYREGLDLHSITARTAYSIPEDQEPTTRQRSLAKNVNFSVIYMGTAFTIVNRYEVPEKEAEIVVEGFYKAYRKVKPWQLKTIKEAKSRAKTKAAHGAHQDPYTETLLGRRRRLPDLVWPRAKDDRSTESIQRAAERQAVNAVIQGTAADMMKLALVELHRETKGTPVQPIMTVHDEVVVLTPEDQAEGTLALVKDCMERVNLLDVPLVAEGHIADRWSEK
jgi:DNA polymerase I-like protein with 3'-5' exonuclease and polymerase domains